LPSILVRLIVLLSGFFFSLLSSSPFFLTLDFPTRIRSLICFFNQGPYLWQSPSLWCDVPPLPSSIVPSIFPEGFLPFVFSFTTHHLSLESENALIPRRKNHGRVAPPASALPPSVFPLYSFPLYFLPSSPSPFSLYVSVSRYLPACPRQFAFRLSILLSPLPTVLLPPLNEGFFPSRSISPSPICSG